VLLNNRIFDGVNAQLRPGHLLLADRKIRQISSGPITPPPGCVTIDGGGRVLMLGLTDGTGTWCSRRTR
jgi:dihydroorotase-like cyclic amidohydrolase